MKKITRLTAKQRARIPEWVDKWIKKGLSTEPLDLETFKVNAKKCYEFANLKFPDKVIVVDSPLVGAFSASISDKIINRYVDSAVSSVGSEVSSAISSVDSEVHSAVSSAIRSVDSEVRSEVSSVDSEVSSAISSVDSEVHSAVSSVGSAVSSAVSSVSSAIRSAIRSVGSEVHSAVGPMVGSVDSAVSSAIGSVSSAIHKAVSNTGWHYWMGGRLWCSWQAYVTYYRDVCGWEPGGDILDRVECYEKAQMASGYWWANKHFVIVSKPPKYIHITNNRLHKDMGKAIEYHDGWGLYMLNGVKMPKEVVMTPAEKLDPKIILNEQNADIQREIIKKIGVERVLKKLKAKCLDKWVDPKTSKYYELLNLKVGSIDRKYMYYEHASLPGYYYAKPVPPEVNKASIGRAWILSMISRDDLSSMSKEKEVRILKNLPNWVA